MACHAFSEAAHPSQEAFTLVKVWRREGAQPLTSTHAAWVHMERAPPSLRDPSGARFRLPFDERGRPTLGHRAVVRWVRNQAVDAADRCIRGRVAARLDGPAPGIVYRELWVTTPPVFRVAEGTDFIIEDDEGELARCFLMAIPLVTAQPVACTVREHLATLGARARELIRDVAMGREEEQGRRVEILEGATIEIVGSIRANPRPIAAGDSTSGPYRSLPSEPPYLIGRVPLSHLRVTVSV